MAESEAAAETTEGASTPQRRPSLEDLLRRKSESPPITKIDFQDALGLLQASLRATFKRSMLISRMIRIWRKNCVWRCSRT